MWEGQHGAKKVPGADTSVLGVCRPWHPGPRRDYATWAKQQRQYRGGGGGGGGLIKKQTKANQRQCTPQYGISASLFSVPNPVEPQDTRRV